MGSRIIPPTCLVVLLACCIAYYLWLTPDLYVYQCKAGFFQYALNDQDHFIYLRNVERIESGDFTYGIGNDGGIALIYWLLSQLFPAVVDDDFRLISLLFNCLVLVFVYLTYSAICDQLHLGLLGKLSFFANTHLVYCAQLINKDMLTILIFLFSVYCGIKGRLLPLILLLPLMILVRQQLGVFIFCYIFFSRAARPLPRIALMYILTSLAAAFLSAFAGLYWIDILGDGFSAFLVAFNQKYFVGYLLFNPVRVLQYFYDLSLSLFFGTDTGGVETAKILRIPQVVVLVLLLRYLISMITRFNDWMKTPAKPLVLAVLAYFLAWLMNPTVNARYAIIITPVLVLFGLYARKFGDLALSSDSGNSQDVFSEPPSNVPPAPSFP